MTRDPFLAILAVFLLATPSIALAHTEVGMIGGFQSGFTHPLFGLDHVVAMVAVGLWGAILGQPAIWMLPIAFPLIMAVGGALGVLGVPFPAVETGISLSGVVLGLLVTAAVRAPLNVAVAIVSVFAVFHGYAHGAELPEAANPIAYSVGFVMSTGLLHLAGIAVGALYAKSWGSNVVRGAGVTVAAIGGAFLFGLL